MKENKAGLRERYRALRKRVSNASEAAERLLENFIESFALNAKDVVSGYLPMDGEIDVLPLMRHISSCSIQVLIPIVEKGSRLLQFKKWEECKNEYTQYTLPNAVIVPLVAFDQKLNRLGFGGGYYDCTIEFLRQNVEGCRCIGVAYEIQLCECLPICEHDQKLDAIVTEKSVYR